MNYQPIIFALDVIEPDTVINNMEFMEKELALIHDFLIRLGHPSEPKDIEIAAFYYLDVCKEDEGYDGWLPLKDVEAWRHKLCKRLYEKETDCKPTVNLEFKPEVKKCETCQNLGVIRIDVIDSHFCKTCIVKIDRALQIQIVKMELKDLIQRLYDSGNKSEDDGEIIMTSSGPMPPPKPRPFIEGC